MATLDDAVLDRLRDLNSLRDQAKDFRERGRNALAEIPEVLMLEKFDKPEKEAYDVSNNQWVSGSHPVDLALLVRVLNHRDLGDYDSNPPNELHETLAQIIATLFKKGDRATDSIPVLTAARAMHALVGKPQTVFSRATMLCYYRIVRELYLAAFPNWIIGAARAGEGGRVSAFVTGECVRAILAFQNSIRDTITFFKTTKRLYEELERLKAIPDVDRYLMVSTESNSTDGSSHWQQSLEIEFERVALDWYAANNLRRNVIALDLSPDPTEPLKRSVQGVAEAASNSVSRGADLPRITDEAKANSTARLNERSPVPSLFPLAGRKQLGRADLEKALEVLPDLLRSATERARQNIADARKDIEELRAKEVGLLEECDIRDLDLIAKRLTEPDGEYEYYKMDLSSETLEALREYLARSSTRKAGSGAGPRPDDGERDKNNKLREVLVSQLNIKMTQYLMASGSDWEKLEKRTADDPNRSKFSKEIEWLLERHLGMITLVKGNKSPWEGSSELIQLNRLFLENAFTEERGDKNICAFNRIGSRRFDTTLSAHGLALRVVGEALDEAECAAERMKPKEGSNNSIDLPKLLDFFTDQYQKIYKRIHRVIDPAKRYIQDVLNRELAQAANSAKFDAGELLFAATCFGAITKWKQNEQLAEARRLLIDLLPEDGRLQTSRPFQSTSEGLRLIPIAFEMTRSFAQLLQKDFREDLDPKVVRKILNIFEENQIALSPDGNDRIGWNFSGAPESRKPSVWVTAIGVFALDRTVRMLNERINAVVLRHFNVERPNAEIESRAGSEVKRGDKLELSGLMYADYELHSAFEPKKAYKAKYEKNPHRVDRVSVAIRLQQMRAHLTRALLPDFYSKKGGDPKYKKAYSAIFYGPPGTGKTTLAEALATTAGVPMVRLSPSDLMVQGTDVIESRARAIFDSLSMLTQAVIFLDEFEPVVRTREKKKSRKDSPPDPPDPPEFRFLVTGMLPKLIKLNKAAEAQSVVYCLATNYLVEVDDAAKRVGRFDLQIPIYNPDPMSRVGVFLYRLITILQTQEKEGKNLWRDELNSRQLSPIFWPRVHEAIKGTAEVSAQSLATMFFSTKATNSFFNYLLGTTDVCPSPTPEKAIADHKTPVEQDIEDQRRRYEDSWNKRSLPAPDSIVSH